RRPVVLEDARAGLAGDALGAEQVLDRKRQTPQRGPAVAGHLLGDPGEAVQTLPSGGPVALSACQIGAEQVLFGERAGGDGGGRRGCRELEDLGGAHACGLGTRKPSSLTAGACASATSRGNEGHGSSGRRRPVSSTTCEVGGTSARSSSPILAMWSSTAESSRAIGSSSSSSSARRPRPATGRTSARSVPRA